MKIERIPDTFEEAVHAFVKLIRSGNSEAEVQAWMNTNEQLARGKIHHSAGMQIRNTWGLWTDCALTRHMYELFGLGHGDDMSGVIVTCAHRELNGLPWFPESEVARYKQHWKAAGFTPKPPWERG